MRETTTLESIKLMAAYLFFLGSIVGYILPFYLRKKLNHILDPHFLKHLAGLSYIPVFSSTAQRASVYACWVAEKRIFAFSIPAAMAFDFKSKFSKQVVFWCWVQALCLLTVFIIAFAYFIYSTFIEF